MTSNTVEKKRYNAAVEIRDRRTIVIHFRILNNQKRTTMKNGVTNR